jgi:hypothetical protein
VATANLMNSRDSRDLFIVARSDAALHGFLSQHFAGRPDVDVISDRRYDERRRRSECMVTERRRAERRRYSVSADLAAFGVAIVTVSQ